MAREQGIAYRAHSRGDKVVAGDCSPQRGAPQEKMTSVRALRERGNPEASLDNFHISFLRFFLLLLLE